MPNWFAQAMSVPYRASPGVLGAVTRLISRANSSSNRN
jgi:hypothetical protein